MDAADELRKQSLRCQEDYLALNRHDNAINIVQDNDQTLLWEKLLKAISISVHFDKEPP